MNSAPRLNCSTPAVAFVSQEASGEHLSIGTKGARRSAGGAASLLHPLRSLRRRARSTAGLSSASGPLRRNCLTALSRHFRRHNAQTVSSGVLTLQPIARGNVSSEVMTEQPHSRHIHSIASLPHATPDRRPGQTPRCTDRQRKVCRCEQGARTLGSNAYRPTRCPSCPVRRIGRKLRDQSGCPDETWQGCGAGCPLVWGAPLPRGPRPKPIDEFAG